MMAHLVGLICIQKTESIARVLSITGKSITPRKSFSRYFKTLLHVQTWFDWSWENSFKRSVGTHLNQTYLVNLAVKCLKRLYIKLN